MRLKRKELLEYVDFYKKDIPQHKKLKNKILKGLTVFVGVQLAFASFNVFRMNNYLEDQKQLRQVAYTNYQEVLGAMKYGDQYKIIDTFSKLKSRDSITSDILAASTILSARFDTVEEMEQHYKVAPETLKTIEYIYQNRWNSGFMAKQKERDSISCFVGDFTCYIARPIIQKNLQAASNHMYRYAATDYYNINHWDEYTKWMKDSINKLEKNGKIFNDSPGDIHVKSLGRKLSSVYSLKN